ncbi:MAG: nucleotidyltransferase domain-containing protein [Magnetococcales bacterium]|nr:nucleotidyltransferase domain-containing protein [Magnetococcales bacterium]
MEKRIQAKLAEIEHRNGVRIVFACESGSRAWGFASRNSDWDVRFIYVHPKEWYLAVDLGRKRDVIELPLENDLDINGWELRKALGLFWKSNPPLLEWLDSPMIYLERGVVPDRLRALRNSHFSPRSSWHHYLHMAKRNYREYLRGDVVWLKKYLYVLRPLLAVRWLERELGPVPTRFQVLVETVVEQREIQEAIAALLAAKMAGDELSMGARIPILSNFFETEFARHETTKISLSSDRMPVEPLNALFLDALQEVCLNGQYPT